MTAGSSPSPAEPLRPPPGAPARRHVGADGKEEQAPDADVVANACAAAPAKVSGNALEREETGLDQSSLDEAHIREADGTEREVLVHESLEVNPGHTTQHT